MKIKCAAIFAALFLFLLLPGLNPARADDVTLTSRDGAIKIAGTLLGFDGEFYRVDTEFGVLTLDGSSVNCDGPGCPKLGSYVARFTLSGAGVMGEVLVPALIEGFAFDAGYSLTREDLSKGDVLYRLGDSDTGVEAAQVTVRSSTSEEGFLDLVSEQADMVLSLREVSGPERTIAIDAGLGDLRGSRQYRVIARDALVPVVNAGNPVHRLTMRQLAAIYAVKITRWNELGGEEAPITLHLTDPETGIGDIFATRVMDAQGAALARDFVLHPSIAALVDAVERDPFGIGITVFSQTGVADVVTLTGDCSFEVAASAATVKAGDYPLTVPMYLYLPARRLPKLARDFLAYMRSANAQLVTRRAGLVDQDFAEVPLDNQGGRLANAIRAAGPETGLAELQRMTTLFIEKRRISLTFRFLGGSTALDAPSLANVATLAAALESGEFEGRRLDFVGFSDGAGPAANNLRLSQRRAEAVRAAVLAETETFDPATVEIVTDGFGEALPMACDDTAWGRRVNRRVEIWVE